MSLGQITLQDALKKMDAGETFSCVFVKYDVNRRTGGNIVNIFHAKQTTRDKANGISRFKTNGNEQIREMHIRLMTHFNNLEIIW